MHIIRINHPQTFEFIPGISLTRFDDAYLFMLTFGTYTLEIVIEKKQTNNINDNNNEQDNGNQSSCDSASR